jgi:hypothetical protein
VAPEHEGAEPPDLVLLAHSKGQVVWGRKARGLYLLSLYTRMELYLYQSVGLAFTCRRNRFFLVSNR